MALDLGIGTIYQPDAPLDLKVVSWPRAKSFRDMKSYAYDAESGAEAIIYIIGNRINARSSVSAHIPTLSLAILTPSGIYLASSHLAICPQRQTNKDRR